MGSRAGGSDAPTRGFASCHPDMGSETAAQRTLLVGCGQVGTRLGLRLAAGGGEAVALRRRTEALPAALSPLAVDLGEPVPRGLLPEVDAMVVTLPPGPDDDAYVRSLRHLADALPEPPSRVVLVSSTRVLEGLAGAEVRTEADAPAPVSARARALLEGERVARERLGALVVRPAGIYGPGRERLVRSVLERTPVQHARRTNRIHETDLVRALEAMLSATDPPRLLHAVDRRPAPLGEVVGWIAARLGVEPPPRVLPEVAGGTVLAGDRLLALLGDLRFPSFEEGYGAMLDARDGGAPPTGRA
ncbi:SDR family NAD(P)-dependent oxidoreductase [Agrococcus lahaulensis]|nr:SDR family NAD(P)-dependent oxidoreductase [Agrococcus lahaulensis]